MNVLLERFAYTPQGTFGSLRVVGGEEDWETFECFTVERPWLENRPFVSCIPEGTYNLVLGTFNRGGYPAYEIVDVPGRSLIKIHRGNTMLDLQGCIAPGLSLGWVNNLWAVVGSARAYDLFMEAMDGTRVGAITICQYQPEESNA